MHEEQSYVPKKPLLCPGIDLMTHRRTNIRNSDDGHVRG